jgi:hypothetical protein
MALFVGCNAGFQETAGKIIETILKSHRVEENGCWNIFCNM